MTDELEIPPMALNSSGAKVFGTPLSEERDINRMRDDIKFLWKLLDDIDTASDIAKGNDALYRKLVEARQKKRHERITSDGYSLFMVMK